MGFCPSEVKHLSIIISERFRALFGLMSEVKSYPFFQGCSGKKVSIINFLMYLENNVP